jgi:aconitate hydratase
MAVTAGTPIELVQGVYASLTANTELGRKRLGRPLTLAEKILKDYNGINLWFSFCPSDFNPPPLMTDGQAQAGQECVLC